MPRRVLVFQSDPLQAKQLSRYFLNHGDRVWKTARLSEAVALLDSEPPELVLIDLDAPEGAGLALIYQCRRRAPMARMVITNRQVDLRAEMQAREMGATIFLREPFTPTWIEHALQTVPTAKLQPVTPLPEERPMPRVGSSLPNLQQPKPRAPRLSRPPGPHPRRRRMIPIPHRPTRSFEPPIL